MHELLSLQDSVLRGAPALRVRWLSPPVAVPPSVLAGTILPTSSPSFDKIPDLGGCPRYYSSDNSYEAGDKVSVEGNGLERIVYECKAFPESRFCDQFEPGHSSKLGWKLAGYCDGTTMPTTSPSWVKLVYHHGCPEEYSSGTHYVSNDKVAVRVNDVESVVYKCSGDIHLSRYCSQHPPGNAYDLGWTLIARCAGTMSPTSSPNFMQLREIGDGCPRKYNPSTTYEAGDQVSVSNAARRSVVYECKSWPDGAFCNAGSYFAPDSVNVNMGWTLQGYCEGTSTPTMSPVVYPTSKCSWYNGTKPVIIETWSINNLALYTAGTRVRKNDRIYRCKEYPYSLWCKMSAYEPEKSRYWTDAWTKAGRCPNISSPSHTKAPTKTPAHATITIFIGGSLTLDVNFTTSGTLNATQTMKLADSVKAAITNIVCTDKESCNIDILTVDNQTVPWQLRGDVQRLLAQGNIVIAYLIVMEITCLLPDCLDKPVNELYMNMTTLLTDATSTLSFVNKIVASESFQALQTVLTQVPNKVTCDLFQHNTPIHISLKVTLKHNISIVKITFNWPYKFSINVTHYFTHCLSFQIWVNYFSINLTH
ncbi:hypothetical protein HJC23_006824 [Cyclotella cryptica]|uniref:Chitin-binding type-3 domain-containing protein n=1 Tax=Cyclotella cryptica TaxID=29204 RepID=A0ABD3NIR6_9STRA